MASIFESLLGPALTIGGALLGQSKQEKATKAYQQAVSQPAPATYGPLGYFSGSSYGFNPQTQANFDAFSRASLDQLGQLSSYQGVGDTTYNTLQSLLGPTREAELSKLRSTLYGQGRLDLGGYRPSYSGGGQVATNPELQAFYEAEGAKDLQAAISAIGLQDTLRNSAAQRALSLSGVPIQYANALMPYGNMSLSQQQQSNLAASEGLAQGLASANNFSSLLSTLGSTIFQSATGTSPLGALNSALGNPLGALSNAFGNPLTSIANALGFGYAAAPVGANAALAAGVAPTLGGLTNAAPAAGALGSSAGSLGALGVSGLAAAALPISLGFMSTILPGLMGHERNVQIGHPGGLWGIENGYGITSDPMPSATVAGKQSRAGEVYADIERQNRNAVSWYGQDIKTLAQQGFFATDQGKLAALAIALGAPELISKYGTWSAYERQRAATQAAKEEQKRANREDKGGH